MAVTRRGLTLGEFLALPEEKPALEYCAGAVRQKVSPEAQHSVLQGLLFQWINNFARPRRLAVALIELRTTFGGHSRVPDVAVCLWGRIPRDAEGRPWGPLREPPLIAIEIASPGQSRASLLRRCRWYVAHGAEIALLVDPRDQSVHDLRADGQHRVLRGDDLIDLSAVIPGLRLGVDQLFATLRP